MGIEICLRSVLLEQTFLFTLWPSIHTFQHFTLLRIFSNKNKKGRWMVEGEKRGPDLLSNLQRKVILSGSLM